MFNLFLDVIMGPMILLGLWPVWLLIIVVAIVTAVIIRRRKKNKK